jgi:hypothetical protein
MQSARPWQRPAAWVAGHTAETLAVGGAVGLLVSLWLPWFAVRRPCVPVYEGIPCPAETVRYSAWEAYSTADVVFSVLAVVAIGLTLVGPRIAAALAPVVGVSVAYGTAIAHLALAATGWSVVALALWAIHRPGLPVDPSRVPEFGFFVALLAGGAITGAGWWSIRASGPRP